MHLFRRLVQLSSTKRTGIQRKDVRWLFYKTQSSNANTDRQQESSLTTTKQMCVCFSSDTTTTDRPAKKMARGSKDSVKKTGVSGLEEACISGLSIKEVQARVIRSRNRHSFVFREDVAEKIVSTVQQHRQNPHSPVLDLLAGPGLVCRQFLKQGVSKVVALDTHQECLHLLKEVQQEFGSERFHFFNWSMVNLYLKLHAAGNSDRVKAYHEMESQVVRLLQQASQLCTDVPYSIVCIGDKNNNENFIFYVLRNLPNEDPILSHGRVEFFFLAHPKLKQKLDYIATIQKSSRGVSSVTRDKTGSTYFGYIHAMIYLFYDVEVLEQFNADDFSPPFSSARSKQNKDSDPSKRLLVRMQLKKNVDDILPLHHHTPFLHFLNQVYKKKALRTIPALEMLMPGCGLRMLADGFTMMDIIIRSNPEKFVKLYKSAIHWPEFVSSPLHNYIMMKLTGSAAESGLSDEEAHLDNESGRPSNEGVPGAVMGSKGGRRDADYITHLVPFAYKI